MEQHTLVTCGLCMLCADCLMLLSVFYVCSHLPLLAARDNSVLPFQINEPLSDENDENLDFDSDFDDLEDILCELIKHKVSK